MTIAFFSNFINHHQKLVADEIFKIIGDNYTFVELTPMPDTFRNNGYADYSGEPYVLQAWKNKESEEKARQLSQNVDVAFFDGVLTLNYEILRAKTHPQKLSFEVSERWLKRGWLNLLSPRLLKWFFYYHVLLKYSNCYKLCSSAFVPNDMRILSAFKGRCLKWGYFTKTQGDGGYVGERTENNEEISIMWCARFLKWKHPELPVLLASKIKEEGYHFHIDMYGDGLEKRKISELIKKKKVEDVVHLKGVMPNEQILAAMRQHDIFLFTSDRNEGWGAVLNEAMSCGCAVVASNEIGATPYLIKDGENGFDFKSKALNSLYEKVMTLLQDKDLRLRFGTQAKLDLQSIWSPQSAVKNLFQCIEDIECGEGSSLVNGPCSPAFPVTIYKQNRQ